MKRYNIIEVGGCSEEGDGEWCLWEDVRKVIEQQQATIERLSAFGSVKEIGRLYDAVDIESLQSRFDAIIEERLEREGDFVKYEAEIAQLRELLKQEREALIAVEANYENTLEKLAGAEAKIARVKSAPWSMHCGAAWQNKYDIDQALADMENNHG